MIETNRTLLLCRFVCADYNCYPKSIYFISGRVKLMRNRDSFGVLGLQQFYYMRKYTTFSKCLLVITKFYQNKCLNIIKKMKEKNCKKTKMAKTPEKICRSDSNAAINKNK